MTFDDVQSAAIHVLHVAPDPRGGWIVEGVGGAIPSSSHETLAEAVAECQAYVAEHPEWELVVHDHRNPPAA